MLPINNYTVSGSYGEGFWSGDLYGIGTDLANLQSTVNDILADTSNIDMNIDQSLTGLYSEINNSVVSASNASVLSINNHFDFAFNEISANILQAIDEAKRYVKDEVTFRFNQLQVQIGELRDRLNVIHQEDQNWQGGDSFNDGIGTLIRLCCALEDYIIKTCGNRPILPNSAYYPPYVSQSSEVTFSVPNNASYPGLIYALMLVILKKIHLTSLVELILFYQELQL